MKNIFVMISLVLLMVSPIFAGQTESNEIKQYCYPEQVELTDSTIFLHLNEGTVEVDSLFVDQGGVYFLESGARCVNCRRPLNPKNTCECPLGCE